MKHLYLIPVASLLTFSACEEKEMIGTGPIVNEERSLTNFSSIKVTGILHPIVQQGAQYSVKLNGPSDALPYVVTKVNNGVLEIQHNLNYNSSRELEALITMPALNAISVSDHATISIPESFTGNNLQISIQGSNGEFVSVSDANFNDLSVVLSGLGRLEGFGIKCKTANVDLVRAGRVELSCSDELKVKISGSGRVYYKGNPKVSQEINGTGVVAKYGP